MENVYAAGVAFPIYLPDAILDKLPFFENVRAPSRIIAFVYLFLAIGVGFAVATALRERRRVWQTAAAVAAVLIVLDFYPAQLTTTPVTCARGLTVLKTDPERGFGVFNLPMSYADEDLICSTRSATADR